MARKQTWEQAIEQVLREEGGPLHYTEIADRILQQGLVRTATATPDIAVNTTLSSSIREEESPFERVDMGRYGLKLREGNRPKTPSDEGHAASQDRVLTSFGLYWERDRVEWGPNPPLLGRYQPPDGSSKTELTKVDFSRQVGVYLLHDVREVIYVGRTDQGIGKRLNDHTNDRLQARWDRFSWFGFLPVLANGRLGAASNFPRMCRGDVVNLVEAILIEAIEPRLNRRRGDLIKGCGYRQV